MTETTTTRDAIVATAKANVGRSVGLTLTDGSYRSVTLDKVDTIGPTPVLAVTRLVGAGMFEHARVPVTLITELLAFNGAAFVAI